MQSDTIGSSKAAVPIPVYRELAAELQVAQAKIIQLQTQNDRLAKQNQVLTTEIQTIFNAYTHSHTAISDAEERIKALFQPPKMNENQEVVIEESQISQRTVEPSTLPREMTETAPLNRGWLTLLICVIVFVSFGAGYLLINASRR